MTLHLLDASASRPVNDAARLKAFAEARDFDKPTLLIDTDQVAANFTALRSGLGDICIHYAVKANPAPEIIARLVDLGCRFDAASRGEIALCLAQGAAPEDISFGNTIKRASDIAWAWGQGITLFAADDASELEKIAAHAPGASVYIRLLVERSEADWPLSRKFGCSGETALDLFDHARALGLNARGISFHVGSQTRKATMWGAALDDMAAVWHSAVARGHSLDLLNIGGGFPTFYGEAIEAPGQYGAQVRRMVAERFGDVPVIMAEPGRGLVGDAGMIVAEVLLVSRKSDHDLHRWVYLDIGRFSGLAETEGEAIRYQFETPRDADPMGPCILAGPSCDSADVLYEKRPVTLPITLQAGDRVLIRNCGAYTSTYSSVWFNGFPPLDVVVI